MKKEELTTDIKRWFAKNQGFDYDDLTFNIGYDKDKNELVSYTDTNATVKTSTPLWPWYNTWSEILYKSNELDVESQRLIKDAFEDAYISEPWFHYMCEHIANEIIEEVFLYSY